jgi:hypothetical protein
MANSNLRYVRGLTVPKTIGTGRKLMHNDVRHTANMPTGVNGFRAWTDTKVPAGFIRCPCGWSGLPHYADEGHVKGHEGQRRRISRARMDLDTGDLDEMERELGRADTSGLI